MRKLVGDEFFEGACRAFMELHPPMGAYLNEYGNEFADFLAQFAPAAPLSYLADVARVEWAVNVALHAGDAPALDPAELAELPEESDPVFTAHPSVSLICVTHPADAIWRAVIEDDDAALTTIDPVEASVFLVISRGVDGILMTRLAEDEYRFAEALFAGVPITKAFAAVNTDMSQSLAAHLAAGRFTHIQVRAPA
jgi:hypothetical protein